MARYSTSLVTAAPSLVVLDHLADFASVADWDPGFTAASLIAGQPALGLSSQVIGRRAEKGLRAELAELALAPDGGPE